MSRLSPIAVIETSSETWSVATKCKEWIRQMSNAVVPELSVSDWRKSLRFYCDVLGFNIDYQRPEDGFAYLSLGLAELMIDQIGVGRDFDNGHLPDAYPFGRGINLQIKVANVTTIEASLRVHGVPLVLPMEERWYRVNEQETGNRQFVVADPDGYLLRFFEDLGLRPLGEES